MPFFSKLSNRFSSSEGESSTTSSSRALSSNARRREQVRRAQKTHRERKAEYVRALEAEVSALRARDAHTTSELKRRTIINDRLKSLLATNNIALPPDLEYVEDVELQTGVEIMGAAGGPQRLRLTHPIPEADAEHEHKLTSATTTTSSSSGPGSAIDFSDPRIAIDFILALEQPCLQDYHNHPDPSEGLGHTMQLQSSVVDTAPATVQTAGKLYWPTGSTWSVPSVQLQRQVDRLLITSQQLPLVGELTPVMCWMAIKDHQDNVNITKVKLNQLKQELATFVTCYGFGGVIDEEDFYNSLGKFIQASDN